jgi:hypothetical protein
MSKSTEMDTVATAVKERPMIFSGPMVKALLEDRKTQTRRVIRNPEKYSHIRDCGFCCPHGQPCDRLWVRETFRRSSFTDQGGSIRRAVEYRADGAKMHHSSHLVTELRSGGVWLPSIYMPRWAARIILEITEVRVERLQEIGEADAIAEGFKPLDTGSSVSAREQFATLWDQINGRRADWITNPWVWAITFKRLKP